MNMQVASRTNITKSIAVMAGVYSQTFDCQIKVNDRGEASTNGRIINIPKPKPEFMAMTWGYCAHEAGHVRFTDFDVFTSAKKRNYALGWLLNVVEDTRIEKLQIGTFPGVKKHFNELSEAVLKYEGMDNEEERERLLSAYIFYYIRGKLTGYPIWDEKTIELENHLQKITNVFFMMNLQAEMDKVKTLTSTSEALEVAESLIDVIKKAPDDQSDQSQGDQGDQGDDQGDQGDDQGDQGDDQGDQGDDQGDQGDQGDDQGDQGDDQGDQGDQGDDQNRIIRQFLDATEGDFREGDLGEELKEILNEDSTKEALTEAEKAGLQGEGVREVSLSSQKVGEFESFARQTTIQLRHSLIKLLEDKVRKQRQTVRRGRRVSRSKVNRLMTGNTRIFKREFTEKEEVSCDVVVLADTSGSMRHNIEDVKVATYALLDCLDRIEGAQSCAFGFSSCEIAAIQQPNEGFTSTVKGRCASLESSGSTPSAEAYWAALRALMCMQASRKVVVMITDGDPDNPVTTKKMVDDLQSSDVTVLCIRVGNGDHSALNFVYGQNNWLHVKRFSDLPAELLRVTQNII